MEQFMPDGVLYVRDLRRAGVSAGRIRSAIESGRLVRLRPGLVALPSTSREIRRAARVGGRLAGVSAAAHHGMWVPRARLTVALPEHSGRLWHPDIPRAPLGDADIVLLRERKTVQRFGVSDLLTTLAEVCLTLTVAEAVAVADSALNRSPVTEFDLLELDLRLPPRARGILPRCDRRADTGSESMARTLFQDAGLDPVPQARIPLADFERVDLLIGDRLVIECDSRTHHGGDDQRLRDLRRDARLTALGFIVLRFDHAQILHEPDLVLASVLRYVELGLHRF